MYSYEERMRAVQLYIKYYFSPSDVIYEMGYPSRNRLRQWYKTESIESLLPWAVEIPQSCRLSCK